MDTISIVGANSYIARNFIYSLTKSSKYLIIAYDFQENSLNDKVEYHQVDFGQEESLEQIDFCSKAIFFFTGKTGTFNGFEEYNSFIDINEKTLLSFLNIYVKHQSKAKIIFPSTRLVYKGNEEKTLTEDAEKEFLTIYAINKYSCENILRMYHRTFRVQYAIFRICVPYGSASPEISSYGTMKMMLDKARKKQNLTLYYGADYKRTVTHISDLCNIFEETIWNEKILNDVYNIGGESLSLYEIAEKIAGEYGVGIDFIEYPLKASTIETGSTAFNSEKLDGILEYKRQLTFQKWLSEQVK